MRNLIIIIAFCLLQLPFTVTAQPHKDHLRDVRAWAAGTYIAVVYDDAASTQRTARVVVAGR